MRDIKNLNDMMLFIAVIDAGSFTLAADRLDIPKANLSRKIARLEQHLGITLLERTTRSHHITEAGQKYLTHCRKIQQEIELAKAEIDIILNQVEGQLRIGVSVGIGHEVLKPVLSQFMHQYPNVKLQLCLLNRRVDLIEEGFDLVIRIGTLDDSRLVAKHLGQISRTLYASPAYLTQHDHLTSPQQLSDHAFLVMNNAQYNDHITLVSGKKHYESQIKPKALVDDFSILRQMTVESVGIAMIPDYMCQTALQDKTLIRVLPQWRMPDIDVYALYPKNRLTIPKVSAFMSFIQNIFKQRLENLR